LLGLNINWDIVLFSAPVADVIYLFINSVHAINSIKLKLHVSRIEISQLQKLYSPVNMSVCAYMFINGKLDNSFYPCLCWIKVSKLSLNVTLVMVELPEVLIFWFQWALVTCLNMGPHTSVTPNQKSWKGSLRKLTCSELRKVPHQQTWLLSYAPQKEKPEK